MRLRTVRRSSWLALALLSATAAADTTLWLVRPLYPGQETLVERTEKALDRLTPAQARHDEVIGQKELALALKGRKLDAEPPCFTADTRCANPIDRFVAGFGFDRVVLVQGGQDEAGYTFRVVSYEPRTGRTAPAKSSNTSLEKALLGAVARVVPIASVLDVTSTPVGATVYVDDVKVGVTPLSTQVLPGERVVRLDLKLHQPLEETVLVPIRGSAKLEKSLDKVAARLAITAAPAGTAITLDGEVVGKDRVDRGVAPGAHTIRLTLENHRAFEQTISVKADEQYTLDKLLEPIPGSPADVKGSTGPLRPGVVVVTQGATTEQLVLATPPPAHVPTPAEQIYDRRSYFQLGFEFAKFESNRLVGRRFGGSGTGRTTDFITPSRTVLGAAAEYGTFGKYFGITVFGLSYLTNADPYGMNVGYGVGQSPELVDGVVGPTSLDSVHINLVQVRALQPQVRLVVWRFTFGLQAGFEFRTGQITGVNDPFYKDGFVPLDLMVAGRANVRFQVVDGLYLYGSGNYTWYLIGEKAENADGRNFSSSAQWGFNAGVGYGF
jgi:hypothetical protein